MVDTLAYKKMNNKVKSIVIVIIGLVGGVLFKVIDTTIQEKESANWPTVEAKIISTNTDTEDCGDTTCSICRVNLEFKYDGIVTNTSVKAESESFCAFNEHTGKYLNVRVKPKKNMFGKYSKVYVHDWTTFEK